MRNNNRFVIELGSANVSIYGDSLILRAPNLGVVRKGHGLELIAAGFDALPLIKNLPEHSFIVRPVEEGAVVNPEAMKLIIKHFFSKNLPKSILDKSEVYVSIPSGLSIAERETIESSIVKAGKKDVTLIESILSLLPYTNGKASVVAILGAGVADLGVIDRSGIINAVTINLGGDNINEKIKDTILEKFNLKIGWSNAERIKRTIGTLYENDTSVMEIVGQDILDQQLRKIVVNAEQIRHCITFAYKRYVEIIESILTTIPIKAMGEVSENGLYIAGGGADMIGVTDFFAKYLKLPVNYIEKPEIAVVSGIASIVNDKTLKYQSILANKR